MHSPNMCCGLLTIWGPGWQVQQLRAEVAALQRRSRKGSMGDASGTLLKPQSPRDLPETLNAPCHSLLVDALAVHQCDALTAGEVTAP